MPNLLYPLIPVAAVMIGAIFAAWRQPGPRLVSAVQHLAAGVVFAAAAAELLPQVKHGGSVWATLIAGRSERLPAQRAHSPIISRFDLRNGA